MVNKKLKNAAEKFASVVDWCIETKGMSEYETAAVVAAVLGNLMACVAMNQRDTVKELVISNIKNGYAAWSTDKRTELVL